jgi:hypothetical protein
MIEYGVHCATQLGHAHQNLRWCSATALKGWHHRNARNLWQVCVSELSAIRETGWFEWAPLKPDKPDEFIPDLSALIRI